MGISKNLSSDNTKRTNAQKFKEQTGNMQASQLQVCDVHLKTRELKISEFINGAKS